MPDPEFNAEIAASRLCFGPPIPCRSMSRVWALPSRIDFCSHAERLGRSDGGFAGGKDKACRSHGRFAALVEPPVLLAGPSCPEYVRDTREDGTSTNARVNATCHPLAAAPVAGPTFGESAAARPGARPPVAQPGTSTPARTNSGCNPIAASGVTLAMVMPLAVAGKGPKERGED